MLYEVITNIIAGAEHYVLENDWQGNIRFDIISIIKKSGMELHVITSYSIHYTKLYDVRTTDSVLWNQVDKDW